MSATWTKSMSSGSTSASRSTISWLQRRSNLPSTSSTYAMPPLMPAAKFRPVGPRTTAAPPLSLFPAVIADALDNDMRAAVPDAESLSGDAAHIRLAGRGAVAGHVANDDVVFAVERTRQRRLGNP